MIKLSEFNELAYRAYAGTSFSPEKRRDSIILESENELNSDLANMLDTEHESYISGYKKHLSAWLHAKSNCVSTMITGGSNFNVRRAEKSNQSEHNRLNDFMNWRENALKAIVRRKEDSKPQVVRDNEIFERAKKQILSSCETIIEIDNGTERGCSRPLIVSNLTNRIKTIAKNGDVDLLLKCLEVIKGVNASVAKPVITATNGIWKLGEVAEAKREAAFDRASKPNREWNKDNCVVRFNYELDRLQLIFEGKPDYNTILKLKKAAFKWSPTNTAWQRQLTNNAIYGAVSVIGEFRTVKA